MPTPNGSHWEVKQTFDRQRMGVQSLSRYGGHGKHLSFCLGPTGPQPRSNSEPEIDVFSQGLAQGFESSQSIIGIKQCFSNRDPQIFGVI